MQTLASRENGVIDHKGCGSRCSGKEHRVYSAIWTRLSLSVGGGRVENDWETILGA